MPQLMLLKNPDSEMNNTRALEREQMVNTQIKARGIANPRVLNAMKTVPRHLFVPHAYEKEAYGDYPLPIGNGQTISQPYIVAVMTDLLNPSPGEKILEIGAGSGYQAAILVQCGVEVITIERISPVASQAKENLNRAGIDNICIITGDGTLGFPDKSPYDGILITAAAPEIPIPLKDQLVEGGRIVAPVGDRYIQVLTRIRRINNEFFTERFGAVRFVPLIGEYGWREERE